MGSRRFADRHLVHAAIVSLAFAAGASAQEPLYTVVGDDVSGGPSAKVGDLDGDGIADLLVGAPYDDTVAIAAGRVKLLSGRDGRLIREFFGAQAHDNLGSSVEGIGDLDADGMDDLLVSAQTGDITDYHGIVFVYSGRNGSLLAQLTAPRRDPLNDNFGQQLVRCGDLDFDGVDDIVTSSYLTGLVYVHSGATFQRLHRLAGGTFFGFGLASLGDVDGDGAADFVVGDPEAGVDFNCRDTGRIAVYSGATAALLFEQFGDCGEGLGFSLESAQDVDGDGREDILVTAPNALAGRGPVRVLSSFDGSLIRRFDLDGFATTLFPNSVTKPADVNGDGALDVITGGFALDRDGLLLFECIISGASGEALQIFEALALDPVGPQYLRAEPIGDVDGDGRAEIAVTELEAAGDKAGVTVVLGNDLYLNAYPRRVVAGDTITFSTREGAAGNPMLRVIEAINGTPTFLPLFPILAFDATGEVAQSGTIPPGLSGYDVLYRSYAIDARGKLARSYTALVAFR